jgi:hypothetical protein
VYFLRRAYSALLASGFLAVITTNSIKDGDTREDGLGRLLNTGAAICMAVRTVRWPGTANLSVSLVSVTKGPFNGPALLDGRPVAHISAYLQDETTESAPQKLSESQGRGSVGAFLRGDGFMLPPAEALAMLKSDGANKAVLRPIINAHELNSQPLPAALRWVVDFGDREEHDAARFQLPWQHVEAHVKPIRLALDEASAANKPHIRYWWRFAASKLSFFGSLAGEPQLVAIARHTKHFAPVMMASTNVFSDALFVLGTARNDLYAVFQSSLHEAWARKYSGSLETRLRYSPSDCFETFAFPSGLWQTPSAGLAEIGGRYHEHRRKLMLSLWLGLTDVYNLFHSRELDADLAKHFASRAKKDPAGSSIPEEHRVGAVAFTLDAARAGIVELRRLHVELDVAVRDAYGWQDLPLEHAFYEVETLPENDRVRYTISPAARKELLKRLLTENYRRAAAESAAQAQTPPSSKKATKRAKRSKAAESPSLFSDEA